MPARFCSIFFSFPRLAPFSPVVNCITDPQPLRDYELSRTESLLPTKNPASLRPSVERKGAKEIAKERGWDKRIDPSSGEEGTAPSCGPVVSRALRTKFTTRGWFDGATPRWAACHLFRRLLERGFARRRNNRRGTRLHEALETGIRIPFLDRLDRKSR